jgi:predicted nucleic acid-binding protein
LNRIVIDASVAVKWFLPEEDSDAARALLRAGHELLAPELLYAEAGSVFRKRALRGEFDEASGSNMLAWLMEIRIDVRPHKPLAESAWRISTQYGQSFYDSLYLALALGSDARLVTADQRFYNAISRTPLASHITGVAEAV